jgi:hypothetical protein
MEEIWKEVKGFEDYKVSNLGRVMSLKYGRDTIRKLSPDGGGYLNCNLSIKGKQKTFHTHKLVAMAFLKHKPCGHNLVIDHINHDRQDNNVENLRITTNRGNCSNRKDKGSSQYVGVTWSNKSKKWTSHININGKLKYLGLFTNELEASNAYQEKLKEVSNGN